MKVALCLSGQPRVVEVEFQKLNETILKNNDVDVFIHTWFDEENLSTQSVIPGREGHRLSSNAIDSLQSLYKPKMLMVEHPRIWKRSFEYPQKTFEKAHTWALEVPSGLDDAKAYLNNTTHCMWYSLMMSNLIKEQYSSETGVQYDWVIRNRIDYGPHLGVTFEESPEENTVYYQHNPDHPDGMLGDWFAMGSNSSMNAYSSAFLSLYPLVKQSNEDVGYWCNELLLKYHLINNRIKAEPIDLNVHH